MLPEKIKQLEVDIDGAGAGQLLKHSVYEFRYLDSEGDLYLRLRAMFPKQQLAPMHLLALVGSNGIGRLDFRLHGHPAPVPAVPIDRQTLLATRYTPEVFDELVRAYLSTGAGIAGMQPKIMVPDRPTIPVPTLIVKTASAAYPGLAANEFLCLTAARSAELLRYIQLDNESLSRFFEQVAFSIMVRNGDGHLKNFGVLYSAVDDCRLAPMFDVVTTSIYRYTRYEGGPELEDRTLALARIAHAMEQTLSEAVRDDRIPKTLLVSMAEAWRLGTAHSP